LTRVQRLADYAIARHDAELLATTGEGPERYRGFLARVAERQAMLIAQWMNVGFIHGVMNTDNMAVSGETIDYGPCAFLEAYDPRAVFSSIDSGGRYAYGNQPAIARWNLARLAECLLPLLGEGDGAQTTAAMAVIDGFPRATSGTGATANAPSSASRREAAPTRRTRRWPTTGSRSCTPRAPTSRSPGAAWPMRPRATQRRCAPCCPMRRRSIRGWRAGMRVRRSTVAMARAERSACAASVPG
jgi:hypothetical protein